MKALHAQQGNGRFCKQEKAARGGAAEVLSLGRRPNRALFLMTILSTPENKLATPGEISNALELECDVSAHTECPLIRVSGVGAC